MTIVITYLDKDKILFFGDFFKYFVRHSDEAETAKGITPQNFDRLVHHYETNRIKIRKLSNSMVLADAGDDVTNEIVGNIDPDENMPSQIIARLGKLPAYKLKNINWSARIGIWIRNRAILYSIICENNIMRAFESTGRFFALDTFEPLYNLFKTAYLKAFDLSTTDSGKKRVVQDFFNDVSDLYDGRAGGKLKCAKLDRGEFKWF